VTARILLTGSTGFVGGAVLAALCDRNEHAVRVALRTPHADTPDRAGGALDASVVGELNGSTHWDAAVEGVSTVIHLAGLAHLPSSTSEAERRFDAVNRAAAVALGRACLRAGVRRLVYVSSIKVNGETTNLGAPFKSTEASALPLPSDPYGRSKARAERELLELARASDGALTVVCVRPPLVYGPGVRANFAALVRAVARGLPLPFAGIDNRRSLVAVENLADFLIRAALHPGVRSGVLLVSDGEDLSTPELISRIGVAMHRPARLFAVPRAVWSACDALGGRPAAVAQSLTGTLQVDSRASHEQIAWRPPVSVTDALARAVAGVS